MASKALVLFFLLACGAGCSSSDPDTDAARSTEEANEETHGGRIAAPPGAPNHSGRLREADGAAAQEAGFHFERVIVGAIDPNWFPEHVVVGDVTADRQPDIVMSMSITGASVVGGGGSSGTVLIRIYAQMPDGSLAAPVEIRIARAVNWGHALELVDLDSNGVPEVALADDTGLTIISRTVGQFVTRWHPSIGRYGALVSMDANGDGRMDVFAQGVDTGPASSWAMAKVESAAWNIWK